jgi:pimeloyl-ACP methyl ester carboxylesterase
MRVATLGWLVRAGALCALLSLGACSDSSDGTPPGPYADEALWLCKPGIARDRCLELDQDTTWIMADNSQVVYEHEVAVNAPFDCFYVYPTVDLREEPGNMEDLADDTLMLRPLYNQAARFTSLCRVFAPKYRQMTIGSFGSPDVQRYFDVAYADVDEAFRQYLRENPRRNFVLMGHSQGSFMLIELLKRRIDRDAILRQRLVSALVIGPYGELDNPLPYANLLLCERAGDTGCIVVYNTIARGGSAPGPDPSAPWPCTDPTQLGGNPGVLANTIYNRAEGIPFPAGVETDWIAYPEFYEGGCDPQGQFAIDVRDGRSVPVPPQVVELFLGGTLHQADYNYAMGDLLRIVEAQGDSMPR